VVRLSRKPIAADKAASAAEWNLPLLYRVPLIVWPQSSTAFSIPILPDANYGADWGIAEVYGVSITTARASR
jgi:hypothetical protein